MFLFEMMMVYWFWNKSLKIEFKKDVREYNISYCLLYRFVVVAF